MADDRSLIHSLCDLEIPSAIQFSPTGEKILYSTKLTWGQKKGIAPVSSIWLASTDVENSSRKLTSGAFNDHAPAWHPDGNSIAFTSDRAQAGEAWAIYGLSLHEGSQAYPITPSSNRSMIDTFAFSPDGASIAYLSSDEKTDEQKRKEQHGEDVQVWGEEWSYARLRVVKLDTKEVRRLDINRHVIGICWSPSGQQLGILSCNTPDFEDRFVNGTVVSVVDVQSMTTVKDVCTLPKNATSLKWADDGKLYFCTGVPTDKHFLGQGVYMTDPEAPPGRYVWVNFGVEDDVMGLACSGGTVVAMLESRLESKISRLTGEVLYEERKEVEAFDVTFAGDDVTVGIATSDVNHPVEVFTQNAKRGGQICISNLGQTFENKQFGACRFLTFPSADSKVQLEALYLMPLKSTATTESPIPLKPLPTVVLLHGGPNTRLTNAFNTYYFMFTPYLLSLGYGILIPNYRGSRGRGETFASFATGGIGKFDYEDVITSTQHAIEMGYADRDNLLVGGWSHGGFLSFCCSVRNGLHGHGWKFKAAIVGAGICDFDSMALSSDLGCVYGPEFFNDRVPWNTAYDDTRKRQACPLWEFDHAIRESLRTGEMIVPPLLILHGEKDARCPISQAWGMRRALQSRKLPFEFVTYPRQGHFIDEQKFWVDMLRRVGRWCNTYIGGANGGSINIS